MLQKRTDLAIEARELGSAGSGIIDGVESEEIQLKNIKITRVRVVTEQGALTMNKPKGHYVTLEAQYWGPEQVPMEECVQAVAHELTLMLNLKPGDLVLVAGLGNKNVTPDALGPLVTESVMVTRHLESGMEEWFKTSGLRPVAVMSPGVLGQTGIETAEVIRGVTERVKPAAVIVVDALASRRLSRLATTIQISDTGINPGSGVGNRRALIDSETLGVPVISVGVPTVVDAATLTSDVLELVEQRVRDESGNKDISVMTGDFDRGDKYELFKECLAPFDLNLCVTPKDIDVILTEVSKVVGFSINSALQNGISIEDMLQFVS